MQRVLFVWPITRVSVWDLARGYRRALGRMMPAGSIRDYRLDHHAEYHMRAMNVSPTDLGRMKPGKDFDTFTEMSLRASQPIINDAIYHDADHVIMVAAFGIHPAVLYSLEKLDIPTTVILTESPYDDINQYDWASVYPEMRTFTTERISARKYGWGYLPHAYDPEVHQPISTDFRCDVLMVGTGWPNRREMLSEVDWKGIDLRLHGYWPGVKDGPIEKFVHEGKVDNDCTAAMYSGAKIVLNIHREHPLAESLNPRLYEAAACGAFQLSDYRSEMDEVTAAAVPTFSEPGELEEAIRYFLKHDAARSQLASQARSRIQDCTFDKRALQLIARA